MINLRSVQFNYGKNQVYHDFSVHMFSGNIYGLLGKNGSGKSTFLKLVAGLIFPQKGKIDVLHHIPKNRKVSFLSQVYLIPEEFNLPDVNTEKLLHYYAPFYPNFNSDEYLEFLDIFEVPSGPSFAEMSLGQKKKAVICFGLACNTPLLLMDEPTNGLDITSKSQWKTILQRLSYKDRCIIISSHQAKDLEGIINRVAIIDQAGLLMDQSIVDIQQNLQFILTENQDIIAQSIYHEPHIGGGEYIVLQQSDNILYSKFPDLEMLYKAAIHCPEKLFPALKR